MLLYSEAYVYALMSIDSYPSPSQLAALRKLRSPLALAAEHHEEAPAASAVAVAAHPVDEVAPPDVADRVEASAVEEEVVVVAFQEVDVAAVALVGVDEEAIERIGSTRLPSHLMTPDGVLSLSKYHSSMIPTDTMINGVWVLGTVFLLGLNLWDHIAGNPRRVVFVFSQINYEIVKSNSTPRQDVY